MNKYAAFVDIGLVGCTSVEIIEADSFEEAEKYVYEMAVERAGMFGYEQDDEVFGSYDEMGRDWNDETEEYEDTCEIAPYVEVYIPEEHDDQLCL